MPMSGLARVWMGKLIYYLADVFQDLLSTVPLPSEFQI